jgi:hypothetical protein
MELRDHDCDKKKQNESGVMMHVQKTKFDKCFTLVPSSTTTPTPAPSPWTVPPWVLAPNPGKPGDKQVPSLRRRCLKTQGLSSSPRITEAEPEGRQLSLSTWPKPLIVWLKTWSPLIISLDKNVGFHYILYTHTHTHSYTQIHFKCKDTDRWKGKDIPGSFLCKLWAYENSYIKSQTN